MEQALSIVDIVQHILSFVSSQRDLYQACLVNSTWAAAGLALLWRYPQCHTLHSFQLLLETLRHELHTRGPILVSSMLPSLNNTEASHTTPRTINTTTTTTTASLVTPNLSRQYQYLLRQSSLSELPQAHREYGIPFQGTRNFYRGEFIRELDLRSLGGMLSHHHVEIIARSPKLGFRSLDFELLPIRFSQDLHRIVAKSKNVRQLRVGPFRTSMDDLRVLRPSLAGLTALHLLHCTDRMYDQELSFILQATRQLCILEIRGNNFTEESLQMISTCGSKLRQLVLETPKLTDKVLGEIISSCKGLEALCLEGCDQLRDKALSTLIEVSDQTQATALTQSGLQQQQQQQDHLPHPSEDRSHVVETLVPRTALSPASSRSSSFNSGVTTTSPAHSIFSSSPPDLTDLSLLPYPAGTKFPGSAWGQRSHLTSLAFLHCDHMDPARISQLIGQCPNLESVALGGDAITDDTFRSLCSQSFTHLKSLRIENCPEVTDDVAMSVFFNCDTIADLTIRGTNFTKSAFDAIAACLWPTLEHLYLERVKLVLNSSVEAVLNNCKNLRTLRLWNCRYLTLDIFTDEMALPCPALEELEFMDKYARPAPSMHIQEQDELAPGDGENPQGQVEQGLERHVFDRRRDSTKVDSCSQKFLECLVTRFENLRTLRLAKLTETPVQPNIVSYLTQLDKLQHFMIIRNPGITVEMIKELSRQLPLLVEFGCSLNTAVQKNEAAVHNMTCRKPRIRIFNAMFDTREAFRLSSE